MMFVNRLLTVLGFVHRGRGPRYRPRPLVWSFPQSVRTLGEEIGEKAKFSSCAFARSRTNNAVGSHAHF